MTRSKLSGQDVHEWNTDDDLTQTENPIYEQLTRLLINLSVVEFP